MKNYWELDGTVYRSDPEIHGGWTYDRVVDGKWDSKGITAPVSYEAMSISDADAKAILGKDWPKEEDVSKAPKKPVEDAPESQSRHMEDKTQPPPDEQPAKEPFKPRTLDGNKNSSLKALVIVGGVGPRKEDQPGDAAEGPAPTKRQVDMQEQMIIIRESLLSFVGEASFGLDELAKHKQEGQTTILFPKALNALDAIRATAMFDARNEFHTMLQKLGLGPVFDEGAVGPLEANARMIREWILDDLKGLNAVIDETDVITEDPDRTTRMHNESLGMLLRAVGTNMLEAFDRMSDALKLVVETAATKDVQDKTQY